MLVSLSEAGPLTLSYASCDTTDLVRMMWCNRVKAIAIKGSGQPVAQAGEQKSTRLKRQSNCRPGSHKEVYASWHQARYMGAEARATLSEPNPSIHLKQHPDRSHSWQPKSKNAVPICKRVFQSKCGIPIPDRSQSLWSHLMYGTHLKYGLHRLYKSRHQPMRRPMPQLR